MSNLFKTFAASFVALAMVAVMAPAASAQSADLQAQIAALLAQIQTLQSQLSASQGTAAMASYNFATDLTLGSKGNEVTSLQSFLESKGMLTMPAGVAKGYFGSLTKASLAKYQASVGISPAVGYFGPKSRTYVNSLAAAPSTGTTTTTGTGTTVVVAPSTGLKVTLASDNPATGSLISGSARVEVLRVALTSGTSGGTTLNGIKFTKTGVLSDSAINNAYLIEGGKVVAQFTSISNGVITFTGLNLGINAGQTRNFTLGIDPASGLTAGNTVAFALNSASDVTSVDSSNAAIAAMGTFPMNGNTMTITSVTNPSIATLTIASSSVGTTVYAGTTNVLVSAWTLTGANSKVNLKSIKFSVVGSATKSDVQNIKLMVNGVQVGSTLASLASDGTAYFDFTSSPAAINTGSSNMQIYADVMGSPSFNFDFGILNTFDVLAVDSTYNSPISVTVTGGSTGSTSGHQITINQGAVTVTAASNTPTGNIAKGGTVTLAKFNVYAAGEAVKVKYLDFKLTFTGTTGTISNIVKNIALVDDTGNQVGSTISTPFSSNTCTGFGAAAGWSGTSVANDCFGTSASPINYIIPANTTRVMSLKGDIQTTAAFTTVVGALSGNTSNLQGMTSSQSADSGSVSGAALTLATNALTAAKNSAVGTITYAKGTSNAKIGSFVLTASSAEGANVSNLTITTTASSTDFTNLLVKVGSNQFGTTKATLSGSDVVTFSGSSPIVVAAGGSQIVDVYADVKSGASQGTKTTLATLTSCVGTGATTYTSVSCSPASIAGQNVSIAGAPTFTVTGASSVAAKQIIAGTTGNELANFSFTDTANVEDVKIQTLVVTASTTNGATVIPFTLSLYNGSVYTTASASSTATGNWVYTFNPASQPVIPTGGVLNLSLKGDTSSYQSGAVSSTAAYIFKLVATSTDITALGVGSNNSATPTFSSANGNTMTVLRGAVGLAVTSSGAQASRPSGVGAGTLGTITVTAVGGPVALNTLVLHISGSLPTSTFSTANSDIRLIDGTTNAVAAGSATSTACSSNGSCTATWSFGTGTAGIQLTAAGQSRTFTISIDPGTHAVAATANIAQGLSAQINTTTDIAFTDALDGNGASASLPSSAVTTPFTASVTYPTGS
ncbi:hypothetical protein HZC33_02235 [Candidatus Wolfebacteria bacterium]|nr:hypothetical protein [Candidatus Wolfebacteria bacterium]